MYEIFEQLLQMHGCSVYQVSKATGISQSTLSNWKSRRNPLSLDKAKKIADYFGVTLDYLMTGREDSESPAPAAPAAVDIDDYLNQIIDSQTLLNDGKPIDEESKELLKDQMRIALKILQARKKK